MDGHFWRGGQHRNGLAHGLGAGGTAALRELAEMEAKSRSKAWKVVQDRLEENLQNLSALLQPQPPL